jgi:NADPH-dependent 7-cyano-7-deazaguanine reductase QueF-like protein
MPKLIYTDHARERMNLRSITEANIASALNKYDKTVAEKDGDTRFIKAIPRAGGKKQLHVVAMPMPKEGKDTWLIKTVWIRGEDDPSFLVRLVRQVWSRLFGKR